LLEVFAAISENGITDMSLSASGTCNGKNNSYFFRSEFEERSFSDCVAGID